MDRLLRGQGSFVANKFAPGMLHARIVRSSLPHGRIRGINADAARTLPGVVGVFTARDLATGHIPTISVRLREAVPSELLQPILAVDRVRYVGEPVAAVIASTETIARDAADLVEVEIDPLAPVMEMEHARAAGPNSIFPSLDRSSFVDRDVIEVGDSTACLERSNRVVKRRYLLGRQTAAPIEPRGILASWDCDGRCLNLWGPTKLPHYTASEVARNLGLKPDQVRVREVNVGGGFGARGEIYPEDLLISMLSMQIGKPIRWTEDRSEHFLATNHSRDQAWEISLGISSSGLILALVAEFVSDMGAYLRTHGTVVPRLAVSELIGPYHIGSYRCAYEVVLTNKTPSATCRSPGCYEATYVRESIIREASIELGIDPIEFRRRNLIRSSEMPYDTGVHWRGFDTVYDSGDYSTVLDIVERRGGELHRAMGRRSTPNHKIGSGCALYNQATGQGPEETAALTVTRDGILHIETGAPSLGQDRQQTFAGIAASVAGFPRDRIVVEPLDTAWVSHGGGTWASRGATVAASAVQVAATALRRKLERAACLGDEEKVVELNSSGIRLRSTSRVVPWPEVVRRSIAEDPQGARDAIRVERSFKPAGLAYPYGATWATVRVDMDTGRVEVLGMIVAVDIGRALDRNSAEDQIRGAAVHGIGGALLEELTYSDEGQPLSASYLDYLLPCAVDIPEIDVIVLEMSPTPHNPLGSKGAGEIGILGSAPAIANAVADALGVQPNRIPITPQMIHDLSLFQVLADA